MINHDGFFAYGYIAADDLDGEVIHDLMYGVTAENLSYREAAKEEIAQQQEKWEDTCEAACAMAQEGGWLAPMLEDFEPDLENFDPQIEEPIIEGVYEDVVYRSSWLGGALNFFILKSTCIEQCAPCSPCVPGAGDLRNPVRDGGIFAYTVPPSWLRDDIRQSRWKLEKDDED